MALHLSMSEKKKFLRIVYDPSLHYVIIKIVSNFFYKEQKPILALQRKYSTLKSSHKFNIYNAIPGMQN